MNVLVINSGSSSLKYQLFDMDQKKVLAKGLCERIGIDGAVKHTTHDGKEYKDELTLNTHDDAIKVVLDLLTGREYGVIDSVKNIDAIGQRVAENSKSLFWLTKKLWIICIQLKNWRRFTILRL